MPRFTKKNRPQIKFCGGKKKGSCSIWAGDTIVKTKVKVAA